MKTLPKNLSIDDIIESVKRDDNEGFCLACGEQACNVEPDARRYECESCGEPQVFGSPELLLMLTPVI